MIYPKKLSSKKSDFILKCCIIVSIVIATILILINKLTTPGIPWAALANAGILYIWITVLYSIYKNVNIAGHVLIQTILISMLTIYIDFNLGFLGWSISLAIPILIIVANLTMLILTIISHKKYVKYAIYQIIIVLLSIVPLLCIYHDIIHNKILVIIAVGISILNMILTLAFCAKDIKAAIIRIFHM